jgi:hypothetical protein
MELEAKKHFLILYGVIVTFVVMSLLFLKRKPDQPTRLNLRGSGKTPSSAVDEAKKSIKAEDVEVFDEDFEPSVRQLGVMFNYNGHSWEAFEALGLPAGSSVEEVQKAYERVRVTATEPGAAEFFAAAYRAIMQSR